MKMPLALTGQPTEEPMRGTDIIENFVSVARPLIQPGQFHQGQAACRTGAGDP